MPCPCPHPDRSDATLVRVERNYLHHHARVGGGYGVVVGGASYATITGNVFEYNNHSVDDGPDWRYSPDGTGPLKLLRNGSVYQPYPGLRGLLVGPFNGGTKAVVLSWRYVRSVQGQYLPEWRFVLWRGLGQGHGLVERSEQNMR